MKNKYVCIFGGGAVRGMAYIGAVKALKDLKIESDSFVGSSVGSIFATLCALGYNTDALRDIFFDFNVFMFKDINFKLGPDFAFSKGEIFENWIREHIEKKFYGSKYSPGENPPVTFNDIDTDLYICSTDLNSYQQFIFSRKNTPDYEIAKAVRISSCFPGLMKPVEYEGKFLVDGDLAKSLPLWKIGSELLKPDSRILEFRLEGCRDCVQMKNIFDYLNSVYSALSNFCSQHVIQLYNNNDKFDYVLIDTKDVLLLDFTMSNDTKERLVQTGYNTTMNYFTKVLPAKKKKLLPMYLKISEVMKELKPLVKANKAESAKRIFMNFICDMSPEYTNLDDTFTEDLRKFRLKFMADIIKHPILPIHTFKNPKEYTKILQGIIEKCESKVDEMTEYIDKYPDAE